MLWLIDGYNLMHAAGAAGSNDAGPEAARRKRRRFLNLLANALGSQRARETTIVFDANSPPADFDLDTTYKNLRIIFALGDESADARIEQMIAAHSAPKSLTVVSTDHRVRRAASRRKAKPVTADEFLDQLDSFRRERATAKSARSSPAPDPDAPPSAEEAAYWQKEFASLDEESATQAITHDSSLLTDEEVARMQQEIDREA
jgi:predicted RNA-binding protein with PIN domain